MHIQLDLHDAQINDRPDGSIEIHGQHGYAVLKGEYATKTKMAYRQMLEQYPTDDSLKIAINVEVPQPVGQVVNEASMTGEYETATERALHDEQRVRLHSAVHDIYSEEV